MKKNNLKFKSLSMGIVIKITFVLIIAFIIMGTIIFYKTNDSIFNLSDNLISQVASARTDELSQLLNSIIVETSVLANSDSVKSGNWNSMGTELTNYMKTKSDVFEMFFYADEKGDSQTTSGASANVGDRGYFIQIMNQGKDIAIENVITSRASGNPIFVIASAVKDSTGKTIGVLGATIFLNPLSNLVQSIDFGYGMLVDGTGLIVATKDGRFVLELNINQANEMGMEVSSNLLNSIRTSDFGNEIIRDQEGKNQIAYYQPVKNSPNWSLIILVPQEQMIDPAINLIKTVILIMTSVLLIIIIILYILGFLIAKPIKIMAKQVKQFGTGDLKISFENNKSDEVGQMALSLQEMAVMLVNSISDIAGASNEVEISSEELSKITESSSKSTNELFLVTGVMNENIQNNSAAIEQINSSIEEVAASIQDITKLSQELSQDANNAFNYSKEGEESIFEIVNIIKETENHSKNTSDLVRDVELKSQNIGKIVENIDNITEQTNLLALNAAIEAARAGEAGKGFAVVADEIIKLAEKSKITTSEIEKILKEIKKAVDEADKSTQETVDYVNKVSTQANKIEQEFKEIIKRMENVNEKITNLTATTEQQSASTEEISGAVDALAKSMHEISEQMKKIKNSVENTAKNDEIINATAEELNALSESLWEQVKKFKYA